MDTLSRTSKQNMVDRGFSFVASLPTGDRFLLMTALAALAISSVWLAISVNAAALIDIPGRGGVLREGIVGTPRFINPILAVTAADQDLAALVYAGLMTLGPDGAVVPDIAESVTVSEDGRTYDVVLKEHVTFHDGTPLTADDVLFTVSRVQDPAVKSPLRASWEGVTMSRVDEHHLQFLLSEPYAPFIENLTVGILPKHIWEQATAEEFPFSRYNSEPVGAGPYALSEIMRNGSGIPESYELTVHDDYFNAAPKIETIVLHFYPTEKDLVDAFRAGTINNAGGLSPASIDALRTAGVPFTLSTAPLPRTFTLFFNQNELPLFRDGAVRKALATVVNREQIVEEVLGGYGEPIVSPLPPGFRIDVPQETTQGNIKALDDAREILRSGGWNVNEETGVWEKTDGTDTLTLSFTLATAHTPVFEQTAKLLMARWEELGVPVTVKQFEQSDLVQTVIRPRQYEALLFGTVVGRELDFFSFWHSSQRNDPGLNVALYANITADTVLASARASSAFEDRALLYRKFSDEISKDVPAIFLYVPTYPYATAPEVQNISLSGIARGSERFSRISDWYIAKETVWPLFIDSN